MSVEQELAEVKKQLEKVINRLDTLVGLEIRHDNTVDSVNRCHKRVDQLEDKVERLAAEAATNTYLTKAFERIGWLLMSSVIGLGVYFLR